MKKIYLAIALATASVAMAQTGSVGINTDAPKATLEIIKSTTANATDAQGVIIPKATVSELDGMTNVATSTLIFVEDTTFPQSATTTKKVDANGFYYFNGTEWVKVGGAAAVNHSALSVGIKTVGAISATDFTSDVNTVVFSAGTGNTIPDPVNFKGKVIVLINNSGVNITLSVVGGSQIFPGGAVRRTTALMLVSNGTNWYRFSS